MRINKLFISSVEQNLIPQKFNPIDTIIGKLSGISDGCFSSSAKELTSKDLEDAFSYSCSRTIGDIIHDMINNSSFSYTDEMRLKKIIQDNLNYIATEDNMLGKGFYESVYRLNDEYAIKIPHDEYASTVIGRNDSFEVLKDKYEGLKVYYGGLVAKFGNFKVLRNLGDHTPAGIPRKMDYDEMIMYYRTKYLPKFAEVSQDSYNDLLHDCAWLNKCHDGGDDYYCKVFDFINPNNIVLKDGKLFWVDDIKPDTTERNSVTRILDMLINKYDVGPESRIICGYGESTKYAREIFNKVLIAGADVKLSLRSHVDRFSDNIITGILKNLKINEPPQTFVENVERIYKIPDKDERVLKIKKYLETL